MHGHGDKPYPCPFPGCERSRPGHGFPRKWNLMDHQRRVHHLDGQTNSGTCSMRSSSSGHAGIFPEEELATASKRRVPVGKGSKSTRHSKQPSIRRQSSTVSTSIDRSVIDGPTWDETPVITAPSGVTVEPVPAHFQLVSPPTAVSTGVSASDQGHGAGLPLVPHMNHLGYQTHPYPSYT